MNASAMAWLAMALMAIAWLAEGCMVRHGLVGMEAWAWGHERGRMSSSVAWCARRVAVDPYVAKA